MKVLVTGANGFVGANLVRCLISNRYRVRALVRQGSNLSNLNGLDLELAYGDIRDVASVEAALYGCEGVFHTAAFYTFWSPRPGDITETNVKGTENVIRAAVKKGISKIVYTGSECALKLEGGLGNEQCMVADPFDLPAGYKRSKCMAEHLVLDLTRQGFPVVNVTPTTPVGPYDIKPTPTGKIIVDYINRKMPAYVDTGLNLVSVGDVARGHVSAMEKGNPGQRYILGNRNFTLKEIFKKLEQLTGVKAPGLKIPLWLALAASYGDEFVSGRLLKRQPNVPVAAVQAARKFRFFDCSATWTRLGIDQTPIEEALDNAISWFGDNGYLGKFIKPERKFAHAATG